MAQQRFASIRPNIENHLNLFCDYGAAFLPTTRSNPRKPAIFYNRYPEFFIQNQRLAAFGQSFLLTQEQKTKQEITHFQILMQKPA